jgi:hypothetical protein
MKRMLRPKASVLPDSAVVPDRNLIEPPPNILTHELKMEQPYYYSKPDRDARPEGMLSKGARVVLLFHDGGSSCHVVDSRGLYVVTDFEGLQPIMDSDTKRSDKEDSSRKKK